MDWNDIAKTTNWPNWTQAEQKVFFKGVMRRGIWQCMGNGLHNLGFWGGLNGNTPSSDWCEIMSGQEQCAAALALTPVSSWWYEAGWYTQMDIGSEVMQGNFYANL